MRAFTNKNMTKQIFEKYSVYSVSYAGGGGEYEVKVGFGWTNGVALWTAATYGDVIERPQCPKLKTLVHEEDQSNARKVETGPAPTNRRLWSAVNALLALDRHLDLLFWPIRLLV